MTTNYKTLKVRQSSIVITPERTAIYLFGIAVFLFVFNLISIILQKNLGYNGFFTKGLVYLFDASEESNVPTFFSSFVLTLAGGLLLMIYLVSKQYAQKYIYHWLLLSCIFIFLAVDETISIHEKFNKIGHYIKAGAEGYLKYPWILPYGLFVLVAGGMFAKFVFALPKKSRNLFIGSAIIYITATIGFEIIEGHVIAHFGVKSYYYLICALEEFLEMTGIIIFIYGLLDYVTFFKSSIEVGRIEKEEVTSQKKYKRNQPKRESWVFEKFNN